MPLIPNGKTDTKLLESLEIDKRQSTDEYVAPRNDVECKLCEIWQDVLKIDKVGINDNFFGIGGDSISVINIISKINADLNCKLSFSEIFEFLTVRRLAELLNDIGSGAGEPKEDEYVPFSLL